MQPTVGRVVHFVQQNSPEHLSAMVCHVHQPGAFKSQPETDGTLVNIAVWDPRGHPTDGFEGVPEDQTGQRKNSWHWPERAEAQAPMSNAHQNDGETVRSLELRCASLEATIKKLVDANNKLVDRVDALEPLVDALNDGASSDDDDHDLDDDDDDDDDALSGISHDDISDLADDIEPE